MSLLVPICGQYGGFLAVHDLRPRNSNLSTLVSTNQGSIIAISEVRMRIESPYLLFLGDAPDALSAKVAQGIVDWRPDNCVGQLRLPGCKADCDLTDMTIAEAMDAGARTLVIGVANRGGVIAPQWIELLSAALEQGLDIAAGLHNRLTDLPELSACLLYTSPSPRDKRQSRMPSSA